MDLGLFEEKHSTVSLDGSGIIHSIGTSVKDDKITIYRLNVSKNVLYLFIHLSLTYPLVIT